MNKLSSLLWWLLWYSSSLYQTSASSLVRPLALYNRQHRIRRVMLGEAGIGGKGERSTTRNLEGVQVTIIPPKVRSFELCVKWIPVFYGAQDSSSVPIVTSSSGHFVDCDTGNDLNIGTASYTCGPFDPGVDQLSCFEILYFSTGQMLVVDGSYNRYGFYGTVIAAKGEGLPSTRNIVLSYSQGGKANPAGEGNGFAYNLFREQGKDGPPFYSFYYKIGKGFNPYYTVPPSLLPPRNLKEPAASLELCVKWRDRPNTYVDTDSGVFVDCITGEELNLGYVSSICSPPKQNLPVLCPTCTGEAKAFQIGCLEAFTSNNVTLVFASAARTTANGDTERDAIVLSDWMAEDLKLLPRDVEISKREEKDEGKAKYILSSATTSSLDLLKKKTRALGRKEAAGQDVLKDLTDRGLFDEKIELCVDWLDQYTGTSMNTASGRFIDCETMEDLYLGFASYTCGHEKKQVQTQCYVSLTFGGGQSLVFVIGSNAEGGDYNAVLGNTDMTKGRALISSSLADLYTGRITLSYADSKDGWNPYQGQG